MQDYKLSLPLARLAPPIAAHAEYRPDIDGLRAVAILGVLIFHAMPDLMPGGFAGVDVFFVISGFLISGIILRALQRGNFSVFDFYARRVKRIFPALIIMLVVVWILAWPVFLWDEYQRLGKHIVGGAGFALNLVLYADFNLYFGVTTSPLIHLWSLGVEEQFYFLWPVFLLALWKWGRGNGRLVAIMIVAALSFALNIAALGTDPTASFYLPSSRMWELAMGSALAYMTTYGVAPGPVMTPRWAGWAHHVQGWIGAALIVAAFMKLNGTLSFPGWWALLPCVGALLLISAGPQSWINRHVLSSPPMVFIGLISYPLYLWHWPLLSIVHIVKGNQLGWILGAVAAAIILAFLTYRYLELPIRSSRNKLQLATALCTAMALCAGVGYLTSVRSIRALSESYDLDRFVRPTQEDWFSESKTDWTWYTKQELITLGNGARNTLFMGDSNMQQYYPRIAKLLADHPSNTHSATFAVKPGCAPIVIGLLQGANPNHIAGCEALFRKAFEYAKSSRVDTIVIAAYWRGYVMDGAKGAADFSPHPLKPNTDLVLERLQRLIAELVSEGKRVYVVLNIPTSPYFDPRGMVRRTLLSPAFTVDVHTPTRVEVERSIGPVTSKLKQLAQEAGASVIDPLASLCDARICPAVTASGEPIYRDFGHLRPSYVRNHAQFLDRTVLDGNILQARLAQ